MRDVKYQYPGHLHIKYEVNLLIFGLTLIYTPGLGRVKINFVSALNFGYICANAHIYACASVYIQTSLMYTLDFGYICRKIMQGDGI